MEEYTLDFFGEKVNIKKPKDLTYLRTQISEKYNFSVDEAVQILLYYKINDEKKYLVNDEDFSNFLKLDISMIYLDIDPNSQIYLEYKSKLEEENIEGNNEIEKLIEQRKNIEQSEEEYLKSYNEKLSNLNRQIDILLTKKLDLVMLKKKKIEEYRNRKEKIDKKINQLKEKENNEVLKCTKKENNNYISFNKVNEFLNNVVEKVKNVTYGYLFKRYETEENEDKIEDMKKITKNAVEEINNLSKLVIKNINEEKNMKLKEGNKTVKVEENNEFCEKCIYKEKHKMDHLSIKIVGEDDNIVDKGIKCKGCETIIWEEN